MKAIYYVFNVRTVHSEDTNYVRFLMSDTDLPRSVCEVSPAELADGKEMAMQTTNNTSIARTTMMSK